MIFWKWGLSELHEWKSSPLIQSLLKTQYKYIKIIKNYEEITLEWSKNAYGNGMKCLCEFITGLQWSFNVMNEKMQVEIRICMKGGRYGR